MSSPILRLSPTEQAAFRNTSQKMPINLSSFQCVVCRKIFSRRLRTVLHKRNYCPKHAPKELK